MCLLFNCENSIGTAYLQQTSSDLDLILCHQVARLKPQGKLNELVRDIKLIRDQGFLLHFGAIERTWNRHNWSNEINKISYIYMKCLKFRFRKKQIMIFWWQTYRNINFMKYYNTYKLHPRNIFLII